MLFGSLCSDFAQISDSEKGSRVVLFLLVSVGAGACALIVLGAVNIRAVVKSSVPLADGPSPSLVQEVPVETGKGPMLGALVLHKQRTLLRPKLLQISERETRGRGQHTHEYANITRTRLRSNGVFCFEVYSS